MAISDIQSSMYESAAYGRKQSIKDFPLNPDDNVLHQFASYNTLFTLSALSTREIRNPKIFFQSKPHDIIAQSAGIGAGANSFNGPPSESSPFSDESKKTITKIPHPELLEVKPGDELMVVNFKEQGESDPIYKSLQERIDELTEEDDEDDDGDIVVRT